MSIENAAALIVAAGRGSRMGAAAAGRAKQYVTLGDRAILCWSLHAFLVHPKVTHIQVVIHGDDQHLYLQACTCLEDPDGKLLPPVIGGATRQASTNNGLTALAPSKPSVVLIHDAARPFLQSQMIDKLLAALEVHPGALPAIPVADTVKHAATDGTITKTIPRDGLWRAQTPQAFHYDVICSAHQDAERNLDMTFTDDASIAEAAQCPVRLVDGEDTLRKITTPADLSWARTHLLNTTGPRMTQQETRIGQGFDVHAFADGDAVTLCGVTIPHTQTLSGHSDADVALHALTDAILGAIGDGDIGTHFPPSDPQWLSLIHI